jgi:hypothetical protein
MARKSKSKMLPKLNPQDPNRSDFLSGTFVIAGLTIVALVILVFTISKIPYRVDPNLPIPTLDSIDSHMNEETVVITGDGIPEEKIALYINDKLQTETTEVDEFGTFEFPEIPLTDEGEYSFEVATIRGSILKKRSEMSNKALTVVDRTPPSKDISFMYPEETDIDEAIISGNADKDSYIKLEIGQQEYETKSNSEGFFQFENIPLVKGENTFYAEIEDEAGNSVTASNQVTINFISGEVNGDGVTSNLPESAGEVGKALDILTSQTAMLVIGLISLVALAASTLVLKKTKTQ